MKNKDTVSFGYFGSFLSILRRARDEADADAASEVCSRSNSNGLFLGQAELGNVVLFSSAQSRFSLFLRASTLRCLVFLSVVSLLIVFDPPHPPYSMYHLATC